MKHAIKLVLLSVLLAVRAGASETIATVKRLHAEDLFHAGEFQVDLGYAGTVKNIDHIDHGGIIGFNYFPWRSAGFGVEGFSKDTKDAFFDRIGFSLIGRFPVDAIRLAPEIKVGFDYDFENRLERGERTRREGFDVFAAVGAELRLTKKLGLVAELRGVRPVESAQREHILAGLKFRLNL